MKTYLMALLMTCGMVSATFAQQPEATRNVTAAVARPSVAAEQRWDQLVAYVNALPSQHRAGHVNMVMNGFRYAPDIETTGEEDHWDTPLEFVGRGAGDCEDFAIAKYFMLLEAGVPAELVRLAFVFYSGDSRSLGNGGATATKRTHVVVLQYGRLGDRDPMVLDAVPQISPLSERDDLQLVFEFGADGSYVSAVPEQKVSTRAINKMMERWTGVLDRMRRDGGLEARLFALGNHTPPTQLAQTTNGPVQRAR